MKIIIIGSAHPLRGGIATFNARLARALQEEGHDVTIYSFSLQYPSLLFPGKTQYTDEPAPVGIRIKSVINSINPLNWLKVGRQLKKEQADIIIVRFWTPFLGPAFGTILKQVKNKKTKIIAVADNVVAHEKKPADLLLTKYFFSSVDRFITMSEEVMKDLQTLTDKPAVRLLHPLYDNYGDPISREEALRKLKLPENQHYCLFFGFIRKYKGLDLLLEAMSDPGTEAAGIHLIVAGEYYGDQEFYENLIKKNGLESRVHLFTDYIPSDEVKVYFSAADCIVLPYRTATQSGITQVAYHFERGMVATNVGGLPEAVKHGKTGIICEPEPKAIANALLDYFTPGRLPDLDKKLKQEKKKYSWETFAQALVAFAS